MITIFMTTWRLMFQRFFNSICYFVSNINMTVNDELVCMWKGKFMVYFMVQSQYLRRGAQGRREHPS